MLCALAVLILSPDPVHAADELGRTPSAPLRAAPAGAALARLGAGDGLGQRMFGRTLHRRRILHLHLREGGASPDAAPRREPFDPRAWLERRARKPGG